MQAKRKTIFIAVHMGFGARYLLRTDILEILKAAGIRIVILTPNADETYFRREFEDENVFVEKLEVEKARDYRLDSKIQPFLQSVRQHTINRGYEIKSLQDHRRLFRKNLIQNSRKGRLIALAMDCLIALLSRSRILRKLLLFIEQKFYCGHFHRQLFEKYRPDMVITTSLGYWNPDNYLMREAREHGALVVPVILSWDNTTTKGMAGARFDRAIAWTETMRDELVRYHDADPGDVFVGGIAHFDLYHRPGELMSRAELFEQMGLSMDRKLILFATASPNTFPWNPDITKILAEAIEADQFSQPCQLVVRIHPIHFRYRDGELLFEEFFPEYQTLEARYPFVHINTPHILSEKLTMDMPWSDMVLLGSLFKHADVMVSFFSTVTLEASIFDLPVVNAAFEGDPNRKRNPRTTIKIGEMNDHNQRVVETGGVQVAYSPVALIEKINTYLDDPSLDADGRRQIVRQECGPNPGSAGDAIATQILRILEAR